MLKKITLINFMSHRETVIEPAEGLTVIAGENNCGKSAIVAAIQCVCSNATGNYMVRHGEKECRVILETDDGHVVEWKRVNRKVSYVVDGETIDRTRGKVPEKVELALRMGKVEAENEEFDVHFADQKAPVFLLDGTPGQRAAFFASSSDAAKLIEMQTLHKGKIADAQRDNKDLQKRESGLINRLDRLKPIEKIEDEMDLATKRESEIEKSSLEMQELKQTTESLQAAVPQVDNYDGRCRALKKLGTLPDFSTTEKLDELYSNLSHSLQLEKTSSETLDSLNQLPKPPEFVESSELEKLIKKLSEFQKRSTHGQSITNKLRLPVAPNFRDTGEVQTILSGLRTAHAEVRRLERTMQLLPLLDRLTTDESTDLLAQKIVALNLALQEVEERKKRFTAVSRQAEQTHQEFHQALETSGTCPTCGQELDPARSNA